MCCSKSSCIPIHSGFCAALRPTDAFSLQILNSFSGVLASGFIYLALVWVLACLVGLVLLRRFDVRPAWESASWLSGQAMSALVIGCCLAFLGGLMFIWESGRSAVLIINESGRRIERISLADAQQRAACGSVGPHARRECGFRPRGEGSLWVILEVDGKTQSVLYCGYCSDGLGVGNTVLRVLPSGDMRVEHGG